MWTCYTFTEDCQPRHRELLALLYSSSVWVNSLTSDIELINKEGICEMAPTVYSPYPRRHESQTINFADLNYYKGSTFYSVILRP